MSASTTIEMSGMSSGEGITARTDLTATVSATASIMPGTQAPTQATADSDTTLATSSSTNAAAIATNAPAAGDTTPNVGGNASPDTTWDASSDMTTTQEMQGQALGSGKYVC